MKVFNYDIWYSYFRYFLNFNMDLHQISKNMIYFDFAEFVMSSTNIAYWKDVNTDTLNSQEIPLIPQSDGGTRFEIPQNMSPIQQQFLFDACNMEINDDILFHKDFNENINFIRVFLGVSYLEGDKTTTIYPQVKIYENGIVLLTFRMLNPKCDLTLEEFIEKHINLPIRDYSNLWTSPGVALANQLCYEQSTINRMAFTKKIQLNRLKKLKVTIENKTVQTLDNEEGFTFNVVSWKNGNENFSIDTLNDLIFNMIELSANITVKKPYSNKMKNPLHTYWKGMPLVYLLDYSNQPENTSAFKDEHNKIFSKILARTSSDLLKDEDLYNYRFFDDYSTFVNESVILWVYSKKAIVKCSDPNRGDIILDKQVQSEMLLYLYALHHKLYTLSSFEHTSTTNIIKQKIYINKIYRDFENASYFGEINNLLQATSKMGVTKLREYIDTNLELKIELKNEINRNYTNYFSWFIGILFGIVGIPTLTTDFIIPLWEVSSIYIPQSENDQKVISYLITLIIFIILLKLCSLYIRRRNK